MGPLDVAGRRELFMYTLIKQYKEEGGRQSYSDNQLEEVIGNHIGIDQLVNETDGYTGADLSSLILRANYSVTSNSQDKEMKNLGSFIPSLSIFIETVKECKPSNTKEEVDKYIKWYNYKFT